MTLQHTSAGLKVRVAGGPQVCFSRPSVDVLFASVAQLVGGPALGVLLTGMGTDGARGMLQMRQTGSVTIAQDENTSIVYGMPKEAARIGAAAMTLPLEKIAGEILKQISQLRHEFGFSVVFITHDLPLLLEISDRIAVMREGEIVELADAERLWTDPQHEYTRDLLRSFPRLTGERGVVVR